MVEGRGSKFRTLQPSVFSLETFSLVSRFTYPARTNLVYLVDLVYLVCFVA